ncbi:MAG: IS30 family transposase [Planctomycetota bacterium]|jgi:IS30 family transposase
MKVGIRQTEIAKVIGVHKSTISRERRRNRGLRGYRPKQAHRFAKIRRAKAVTTRISPDTWILVERLLRDDWSPEQISGWLSREFQMMVSHESIYQFVLKNKRQGGTLYLHLRCKKQRRKRYGSTNYRGRIPDRISIDRRPVVVDKRSRIGDWELDTIIGKGHKQAIVSLTERKSRLTLIAKVKRKSAELVSQSVQRLLEPIASKVFTLTSDNGKEFARHQEISTALQADFYFAHPYSSWERGLNENTNGLIRQYFPKKHDFTTITEKAISMVMNKLNNRPRKCLGYKTPNEVFFGIKPKVALQT